MDQETLNALSGFESVWQRVLAGRGENAHITQETSGDGDALDRAAALWETYTAYARQTKGEAQARFSALAEEVRETVRELQTEHFLRTGDLYAPSAQRISAPGILTGMRRAYEAEGRLAELLSDRGGLAEAARRREAALREMIASLLRR